MIFFILGSKFIIRTTLGGVGGVCTEEGLPLVHPSCHSTHVPSVLPALRSSTIAPPPQSLPALQLCHTVTHPRGHACPTESETGQRRTGAPSFLPRATRQRASLSPPWRHPPPSPSSSNALPSLLGSSLSDKTRTQKGGQKSGSCSGRMLPSWDSHFRP